MDDSELAARAAWLYYKGRLTQQYIANTLKVSRPRVVRLIEQARLRGIVQIHVRTDLGICIELEQTLRKTFDLDEAIVVPVGSKAGTLEAVGRAAAQYLETHVNPGDLIATGWGVTIAELAKHLIDPGVSDLRLVATNGGWVPSQFVDPYYIVSTLAAKLRARCFYILAPALAESEEMAQRFRSDPMVASVLEMIPLANLALVGIGGVSPEATLVRTHCVSIQDMEVVSQKGGVGSILGRFFDINGTILQMPLQGKNVTFPLERLRSIKRVVGISCGPQKIRAILGALRGRFLHVLITDEETARGLMRERARLEA
jgi:lsr operon transcriptional repressor